MPQFTPADRETVMDSVKDDDKIHSVGVMEPDTVVVVYKSGHSPSIWNTWGCFVTGFGWAVTAFHPNENGDVLYLAPITEVDIE